jgi:alpha-D-ribose 1-methylphosphonate 5-triphosphate synthase subunit PhnH
MAAAIEMTPRDTTTGFSDPVHDSQAVFRAVLTAMSRPGTEQVFGVTLSAPSPLTATAAAVALTLLDQEVSAWLSPPLAVPAVRDYLTFHTGARILADAATAHFVICASPQAIPLLETLAQGTADYPDRSATVIVDIARAPQSRISTRLAGPGIEHPLTISLAGFDAVLWQALQRNHGAYPLGIDLVVCTASGVIGLPRSTKIEVL